MVGTVGRGYSHESRRDAASRNLAEVVAPAGELVLPAIRARHMDLSLGDSVNVSNALGAWGEQPRQRRHMKVVGITDSPMKLGVGVRLLDDTAARLNGTRFGFNYDGGSELLSGGFRFLPHNGFQLYRPERAWTEDPRGGPWIIMAEPNIPRPWYVNATTGGVLCERRGRNLLLWTTFGASSGGWPAHTGAGTTTNDTSTIFDNTWQPLFSFIQFQRVILTAGNPHGSDGVQAMVASRSTSANVPLTLSLYHQDDAGATLAWRLSRSSDGFYWNEGTRAWGAGVTNNSLAVVNTSPAHQVAARAITGTAGATTYTVSLVQPSGGTVSRVNRIFHVQLEEKKFHSSPMPVGSAYSTTYPGQRPDEIQSLCSDSTSRVFVNERGTFLTRVRPFWSTADLDGLNAYLLYVEHDANNSLALYFDGSTSTKDRLVLDVKSGGSTTTFAASVSVTRNTTQSVAMRWASQTYNELSGDYGTPSGSNAWFDVWFGTTKLFSGQAALPTEATSSRVQMCAKDGNNIDGVILDWAILKNVIATADMPAAL